MGRVRRQTPGELGPPQAGPITDILCHPTSARSGFQGYTLLHAQRQLAGPTGRSEGSPVQSSLGRVSAEGERGRGGRGVYSALCRVKWDDYFYIWGQSFTLWGFPGGINGTEPACQSSRCDVGPIPGSGRSPGGGHGNPLQDSCLKNPMDRGAWWARVHGVPKSQTRLKWLSTAHSLYSHTILGLKTLEKRSAIFSYFSQNDTKRIRKYSQPLFSRPDSSISKGRMERKNIKLNVSMSDECWFILKGKRINLNK